MKYKKVLLEVSVHVQVRYLHQDMGMKTRDIIKRYPQVVVKEQNNKSGRPTKMTVRDQRIIKKMFIDYVKVTEYSVLRNFNWIQVLLA